MDGGKGVDLFDVGVVGDPDGASVAFGLAVDPAFGTGSMRAARIGFAVESFETVPGSRNDDAIKGGKASSEPNGHDGRRNDEPLGGKESAAGREPRYGRADRRSDPLVFDGSPGIDRVFAAPRGAATGTGSTFPQPDVSAGGLPRGQVTLVEVAEDARDPLTGKRASVEGTDVLPDGGLGDREARFGFLPVDVEASSIRDVLFIREPARGRRHTAAAVHRLSPAASASRLDPAGGRLKPRAMTLHLIKLCVGPKSLEELRASVEWRAGLEAARHGEEMVRCTTRMVPKRVEELLDGGSLYWVIKGHVQCRQTLLDVRPATGADGHKACDLVLAPEVVPVRARPQRPFQGWRYLEPADAPADLAGPAAAGEVPREMARELIELCLL